MTPQVKLVSQQGAETMIYKYPLPATIAIASGTAMKYKNPRQVQKRYAGHCAQQKLRPRGMKFPVRTASMAIWPRSYLTYVAHGKRARAGHGRGHRGATASGANHSVSIASCRSLARSRSMPGMCFYDLMDNMLKKYEPSSADTGAAVVKTYLQNACQSMILLSIPTLPPRRRRYPLRIFNPVEAITRRRRAD